MEKLWKKLVAELRSYCHQNGFTDVILGLSGGMDSALVSVLATDALGADHVHALMMTTCYTSNQSLKIADELCKLNGFSYQVLDIAPLIRMQENFLTAAFDETPKNLVMENLQARERGKILMAYANQYHYLVLACGNRSEAAMGYCTLYGDTCGGIMPIGNLFKTRVFELAKWRNKQSFVFPEEVISRAPSAELSAGQKDEDTLPPYDVLDKILELYLDKKMTLQEVCDRGFEERVVDWVIKHYQKTAFKRIQMPPSL